MATLESGAAQAMPHAMHMMHSYFYWGPEVRPFGGCHHMVQTPGATLQYFAAVP